jgi:hypothetical protein
MTLSPTSTRKRVATPVSRSSRLPLVIRPIPARPPQSPARTAPRDVRFLITTSVWGSASLKMLMDTQVATAPPSAADRMFVATHANVGIGDSPVERWRSAARGPRVSDHSRRWPRVHWIAWLCAFAVQSRLNARNSLAAVSTTRHAPTIRPEVSGSSGPVPSTVGISAAHAFRSSPCLRSSHSLPGTRKNSASMPIHRISKGIGDAIPAMSTRVSTPVA